MIKKFLRVFFIVIAFIIIVFPSIDVLIARYKTKTLVQELLDSEDCLLELKSIDKQRIDELLIVEDPSFFEHKGVDFKSPGAGWTTISQGLVKLFYFKKFTPGIAKIRLILITRFAFNPLVVKEDQLKLFFNYAYLGNNNNGKEIKGFMNASRFYFQRDFFEITDDEYLSLVAMLINPNRYRIDKYPDKNKERLRRIKNLIMGNCQPTDWRDCELEGCK